MAPTAASNSSAKRMSSVRRAALLALFWASCAAASRSALAIACILNSSTAPAISPSSSLRPRPGSTTSKLPPASSRIALHIAVIGREMPLPSSSASTPPSRKPPAASIRIRRSVSPIGRVRFRFRAVADRTSRSAFIALAPLHDRRRRLGHLADQLVDRFRILDQLGQRLPVFFEQRGSLLEALHDLFVLRRKSRAASSRRI